MSVMARILEKFVLRPRELSPHTLPGLTIYTLHTEHAQAQRSLLILRAFSNSFVVIIALTSDVTVKFVKT